MSEEHITPSLLVAIRAVRQHGFQAELQERTEGGYGIVLPIDGNYFEFSHAYVMLDYWNKVIENIDGKINVNKKKFLYKDIVINGDIE